MADRIDTIIVGAGQAGLSTSYSLKQQGWEHLILERESHFPGAGFNGKLGEIRWHHLRDLGDRIQV